MKLSEWARRNGVSYRTALRWYHEGNLPAEAEQLPTGTILVYEKERSYSISPEAAIYARVSSHDQKQDLLRQVLRLKDYAAARGLRVKSVTDEIGSGLNGHRRKLTQAPLEPERRDHPRSSTGTAWRASVWSTSRRH